MSEWIKWDGGECPVPPETEVKVQLRNGTELEPSKASRHYWEHRGWIGDIFAYHVVKEVQQGHTHAALMAEYAEIAKTNPRPWDEFEFESEVGGWVTCTDHPKWRPDNKYRRKPKQKKTVRMYQWIRKNSFTTFVDSELFREGTTPPNAIQRIEPGFEIEVEE